MQYDYDDRARRGRNPDRYPGNDRGQDEGRYGADHGRGSGWYDADDRGAPGADWSSPGRNHDDRDQGRDRMRDWRDDDSTRRGGQAWDSASRSRDPQRGSGIYARDRGDDRADDWGRDQGRAFGHSHGTGREQGREQGSESSGQFRGKGPKGYTRSDERIREDLCDKLSDEGELDASDISVSVAGGEVTLDGHVSDRQAKRRAEDIADRCSGVSHVQNNLRVKDSGQNAGHKDDDTAGAAGQARNKARTL